MLAYWINSDIKRRQNSRTTFPKKKEKKNQCTALARDYKATLHVFYFFIRCSKVYIFVHKYIRLLKKFILRIMLFARKCLMEF